MANCNSITLQSPILITGAGGFVGQNLAANLAAQGYTNLLLFDKDSPAAALAEYAGQAQFVFHLAGVNRPTNNTEFYTGNADLTAQLLGLLQAAGNKAPLVLTSTTQAGNGTDYAKSKEAAETAVFAHGQQNQSDVYVYRLPGVFGKWSRPNYNTVVATFCHNVANNLPLEIRDPAYPLPLCYIDDVIASFTGVLTGCTPPPAAGQHMGINPTTTVTLGQLASLIQSFKQNRTTLALPNMGDAFTKKLYATYLSYLPQSAFSYPLTMHTDERGSFTEFLRTPERGQVSVNVSKPGIVKGNHWHNTKNEKFLVVRGSAVIRFRKVGDEEIIEYKVSGEKLEVVDIPTGYTHNIENVGEGELVTVMWASEPFDPKNPDTYFEKV
ncbi:NAD-dependent epimerase/dehydratase family protein [Ruminococcaceae bacterium OttesenSCG-928-A16]|nr:NAD-dependent epimerase/dehydratase family protein [Ruminococcaceae bacterium OttesenSCG-928-A16]